MPVSHNQNYVIWRFPHNQNYVVENSTKYIQILIYYITSDRLLSMICHTFVKNRHCAKNKNITLRPVEQNLHRPVWLT